VGQATECQASWARRRRSVTSQWVRQGLRPRLRMQPETIDLTPIGFLNPARRPIAQTGQQGCRLLRRCNSKLPGLSGVESQPIKQTRQSTQKPTFRQNRRECSNHSERALDSNRVLVIQRAARGRRASKNGPRTLAENGPVTIVWQNR